MDDKNVEEFLIPSGEQTIAKHKYNKVLPTWNWSFHLNYEDFSWETLMSS